MNTSLMLKSDSVDQIACLYHGGKTSLMPAPIETHIARLTWDDSQYRRGIADSEKHATRLQKTLGRVGSVARVGLAAGAVAAGALAVGIGAATVKALGYEKQMANINTLLKLNSKDSVKLKKDLLAVSSQTTSKLGDVADAFYDIASGVADSSKHMDILIASEQAATAGFADLKATTGAMVGVMNAYSFAASDATSVSDVLISSVANGVLTMDQLAAALPAVSGLAATLGISFSDLSGSLAGITKTGVDASVASTQLKAIMTSMIKPTEELKGVFQKLGYESGQALLSDKGLMGAVNAIASVTTKDEFTGLFANVRALTGGLNLLSPAAQDAHKAIQDFGGATGSALKATGNHLALDQMRTKLVAISTAVGLVVTPRLLKFVDEVINPLLDKVLRLGQVLGIVGDFGSKSAKDVATAAQSQAQSVSEMVTQTVKQGDTLSHIALQNKMTLSELEKLNPDIFAQKFIHAGDEVILKLGEITKAAKGVTTSSIGMGFDAGDMLLVGKVQQSPQLLHLIYSKRTWK